MSKLIYNAKTGRWYDKHTKERALSKGEAVPKTKLGAFAEARAAKAAKAAKIPPPPKDYKPRPVKNDMDTPMGRAARAANAKPDPELTSIDLSKPSAPKVKAPDMTAPAAEAAKPAEKVTAHIAEAAAHSEPSAFRRILNNVIKSAPHSIAQLGKQSLGYAAFGVVQDQAEKDLKEHTGIELNPNVSSFIGGAVPEYLLAAGSKIARLRTALLWGAGSVAYDLLTGSQNAADEAQKAADSSIMPETDKARAANEKLQKTIQRAENERAMAHGVIPDGRGASLEGVGARRDKIAELLNKAEAVKNQALVDRFDAQDPTLSGYEYRKAQKLIALNKTARAKITAKQIAAQHQARIDKIANTMSGGRMATIRKGYDASAQANAAASKAKGSQRKSANQLQKTGFDNTPTPYQHKFMWVDKNGKVYHRKMTLPDLQRRQTQSLDKYRK